MEVKRSLIIVDFDKTIYRKDSLIEFCKFIYNKYPYRLLFIFPQIFYTILWYSGMISTRIYKDKFLLFLYGIDREKCLELLSIFWQKEQQNLNHKLLEEIREKNIPVVCISASPDIFIQPVMHLIPHLDKLIGTKLTYNKRYTIKGENCKGEEKVIMLNKAYPIERIEVIEAYSDSMTDLPILRLAKHAFLIRNGTITPFKEA